MSFPTLVSKLTTLKYPNIAPLRFSGTVSFHDFTIVLNFLENQYIRVFSEAERQRVAPMTENGDIVQYMNNLTEYLSNELLNTPQILTNLAQKIVSVDTSAQSVVIPVSPPPSGPVRATVVVAQPDPVITPERQAVLDKETKTRLILLTFLVAKAIEYEYSDIIQNGSDDVEEEETMTDEVAAPGKVAVTSASAAESSPDFPLSILQSLPLSPDFQLNITDPALWNKKGPQRNSPNSDNQSSQAILRAVQKMIDTMSLNKNVPLQQASKLQKWSKIPVTVATQPDLEEAAFNKSVEENEQQQTVAKPIAHWLSMTSANVLSTTPTTAITTVSTTPVTPTVVVAAKIVIPDANVNDSESTIISIPQPSTPTPHPQTPSTTTKGQKGKKQSQSTTTPPQSATLTITPSTPSITPPATLKYNIAVKPIFEITNIDERNMTLYQYIIYNTSLFAYMIPITSKLGVYFTIPRELYEFTMQFNDHVSKLHTQHQTDQNTKTSLDLTELNAKHDAAVLFTQIKAVNVVLSSVLREFARKIQSELTTVLLAFKTFEPAHETGIIDPAIVIPLDDAVKYDEKGEVVVNEHVPLTMPSHIFVNSSSNLKKNNPKKGNKGGKAHTTEEQTQTTTSAAEHEQMIDTTLVPKTNFKLSSIQQSRLKKEHFASRNANITTFINDRYHFNKLQSISTLKSQTALNQLLHLNTLPLGESAIHPQLAAQVEAVASQSFAKATKNGKQLPPSTPTDRSTDDRATKMSNDSNETSPVAAGNGKKGKQLVLAETPPLTQEELENLAMLGRSESFLSIFVTLVRMLYDIELQQHQTVITRWIQYLQTFTARAGKSCTY